MTATKWQWVVFGAGEKGAVSHATPASLVRYLVRDMRDRGVPESTVKPLPEFNIDMPGMIRTDRPWEIFQFYGLHMEIPSEDILSFISLLKTLPVREFPAFTKGRPAVPYYKMHGFMRAMILRPIHKVALELMLTKRLPEAETRSKVFYADKKSHGEVLREAAAKVSGKPIESIPDLGGHNIDRHLPRERGQA